MNLSQLNKKLITIVGIVLVIVAVALVTISIITKNHNLEFPVIEQKLKSGAQKYFKDNPDLLPKINGSKTAVGVTTLEDGKYIPMMSIMVKGDTICNGEVRVSNNGGYYLYIPYLNCGNEYVTNELYKHIIEPNNIVTKDNGLYSMNGEYVFRGNHLNNYLSFDNKMWVILKVDKDKNIVVTEYENKIKNMWDNRYNEVREQTSGINDYSKSKMEDFLREMFNGEEYLSESAKGLVVYKSLCVGKRSEKETNKTGSVECSVVTEPQPLGLIKVSDFMNASLDQNCKETTSRSCQNYNYLADFNTNWWTMTPHAESTHRAYKVSGRIITPSTLNVESKVRPVLHLSENIVYNGGTGTFEDPYIVK
ncbi:MAG: hypothetical protein PHI05_02050 [Bacilli bacterium]|nr:hypothetical protein [Bacilli bacterium]